MIKENTTRLLKLNDMEWGLYAFSRDPLEGKLSADEKRELILKANKCGADQAKQLIQMLGERTVKEYADKRKIQVTHEDSDGSDNYIVFAKFNYPNKITIYSGNVEKVEKLIEENDMGEILGQVDIESVLLAHEMYHYFEESDNDIYTKNKKIELWKLGPIHYKSKLIALSEIAAMSFAQELLHLNYNLYVFDAIMLYPHDAKKTKELIDNIMTFKTK
jgi:hypothetical protein